MLNKKRKGFTIVELVIVIAVIAILAAVLIPTFAGIIDKANESADKQAVRQMNIALAAEAIENEPADVGDVIDILAAAGFNSTDKLVPVSAGHGFYWCKAANMIMLIRDEGENSPQLIFPTEEAALNDAFDAAKTDYLEINFGTQKDQDSEYRTFFDFEPVVIERYPSEDNGGESGGVTTVDGFKTALAAALETGGTVTLGGYIEITEAISIPSGATATIDLNGQELKLIVNDSDVFSVLGELTIKDTKDENGKAGKIVINNNTTDFFDDKYYLPGICVGDSTAAEPVGKLTLSNVEIEGNAPYNIINYGTVSLETGTEVTVNGGTGLSNEGTGTATISSAAFTVNDSGTGVTNKGEISIAGDNTTFTINSGRESYPTLGVENYGDATITGGSFVASGTYVTAIENRYWWDAYGTGNKYIGKMTINGTVFSEADGVSVSYNTSAPIVHSGEAHTIETIGAGITLNDVTVTSSNCSVAVKSSGAVIINGGIFSSKLHCDAQYGYTAIYGDVTINNTASSAFVEDQGGNEGNEATIFFGKDHYLKEREGDNGETIWVIYNIDDHGNVETYVSDALPGTAP